jgi:O-antigen ligase
LILIAVALGRLVVDYPEWKTLAIRDASIAVEAFALAIGFRIGSRDGFERWERAFSVIFAFALIYGVLVAVAGDFLLAVSPNVGLQSGSPLLGAHGGTNVGIAAAGLFFAIFKRGVWRAIGVGTMIILAALAQSRGLYIAIPLAFLILGWAMRRPGRVLMGSLAAVGVAAAALSFIGQLGVEGRLGTIDPTFYVQHALTLTGGEGKGEGTIRSRVDWATKSIDAWSHDPGTIAFGVGFGDDLTFGFRGRGGVAVRKPHNDFLEVLARMGVVGLAAFLALLIVPIRVMIKTARNGDSTDSRFCAWALGVVSVYLAIAATQPLLAYAHGTMPLFFLLGMGTAAAGRVLPRAAGAGTS